MRDRLTKQAMGKNDSPTTMDVAVENPPVSKYETGDPESWAEGVNMEKRWDAENKPGGREETGHPAKVRDEGKQYTYASAVREAKELEDKALRCLKMAEVILGDDTPSDVIERQAVDFMTMSGKSVYSTLRRIREFQENISEARVASIVDAVFEVMAEEKEAGKEEEMMEEKKDSKCAEEEETKEAAKDEGEEEEEAEASKKSSEEDDDSKIAAIVKATLEVLAEDDKEEKSDDEGEEEEAESSKKSSEEEGESKEAAEEDEDAKIAAIVQATLEVLAEEGESKEAKEEEEEAEASKKAEKEEEEEEAEASKKAEKEEEEEEAEASKKAEKEEEEEEAEASKKAEEVKEAAPESTDALEVSFDEVGDVMASSEDQALLSQIFSEKEASEEVESSESKDAKIQTLKNVTASKDQQGTVEYLSSLWKKY
jgi:hypothetical protein